MSVVVKIIALKWYRIPIKVSGIFLKTNVNILLLSSVCYKLPVNFIICFHLICGLKYLILVFGLVTWFKLLTTLQPGIPYFVLSLVKVNIFSSQKYYSFL